MFSIIPCFKGSPFHDACAHTCNYSDCRGVGVGVGWGVGGWVNNTMCWNTYDIGQIFERSNMHVIIMSEGCVVCYHPISLYELSNIGSGRSMVVQLVYQNSCWKILLSTGKDFNKVISTTNLYSDIKSAGFYMPSTTAAKSTSLLRARDCHMVHSRFTMVSLLTVSGRYNHS